MLRPAQIHETFDLAIDLLTCLWGGLLAPKLCEAEMRAKLAPYTQLISFSTSLGEDSHLSKDNYFNICASPDRLRAIANNACCLVAVFAFENLKNTEIYDAVQNDTDVNFLRHLRNAAAHGNSFNFIDSRSRKVIDPGKVRWRGKIIEKGLQDKTAFPDFFGVGDFAYLFEDISKIIK
jgi:hypothetical protein